MPPAPKKILIIEDSLDNQQLYQLALKDEHYQTAMVANGRKALAYLELNGAPDLILLDLNMPEMSGSEFMKKMKANLKWRSTPVIVISGREELKTKAQEIGADGFVRKPFDLSKFYGEIQRLLN